MFTGTYAGGKPAVERRIPRAFLYALLTVTVALAVVAVITADGSDAAIDGRGTTDGVDWTIDSNGKLTLGDYTISARYYSDWRDCPTKVVKVTVNDNVTKIPDGMFRDASSIKDVVIMSMNTTTIGDYAFFQCTNISSLTIPYIRVIGNYAFQYCNSLTSVSLHAGITKIGAFAFSRCDNLSNVVFYGTPELGTGVFHSDHKLVSFRGSSDYFNADKTMLIVDGFLKAYCAGNPATFVNIPSYVTSVCSYAFAGSTHLTRLDFPANVRYVEPWSFSECTALTDVSFPENPQYVYIGDVNMKFRNANGNNCSVTQDFKGRSFTLNNGVFTETASYKDFQEGMSVAPTSTSYDISIRYRADFTGRLMLFSSGSVDSKAVLYDMNNRKLAENDDILKENYIRCFGVAANVTEGKCYILKVAVYSSNNTGSVPIYSSDMVSYGFCQSGVFFVADSDGDTSFAGSSVIDENNRMGRDHDAVKTVRICEGITGIGKGAFKDYIYMTSVSIARSVVSIGENAFYGCTYLETVTIPNTVKSLGNGAFMDCKALTEATIGTGITTIGNDVFNNCFKLRYVAIKGNVTSIGERAFCSTALTSIVLPDSLTTLGHQAFGYSDLVTVHLPANVSDMSITAFFPSQLESFTVSPYNTHFKAVDGVLYSYDMKELVFYPRAKADETYNAPDTLTSVRNYAAQFALYLTHVTLPGSVKTINEGAFRHCYELSSVVIGEGSSVTLGKYAFADCPVLSHVELPSDMSAMDSKAFWDYSFKDWNGNTLEPTCDNLKGLRFDLQDKCLKAVNAKYRGLNVEYVDDALIFEGNGIVGEGDRVSFTDLPWYPFRASVKAVEFRSGITGVGFSMMYEMDNLKTVSLGDTFEDLDPQFISGCPSFERFKVSDSNRFYKTYDGVLYTKDGSTLVKYPEGKTDSMLFIPDGVTHIGNDAVKSAKNLTAVYTNGVTDIGYRAFLFCTSLNILVMTKVVSIGVNAFRDLGLEYVFVAPTLTNVGGSAFEGLIFHDSVTGNTVSPTKETPVFAGNVYIGTYPDLYSLGGTVGDIVWRYSEGDLVFDGKGEIPDYIASGAPWANIYADDLRISEGVTSIGYAAFYTNDILGSITFPSSIRYISSYAFNDRFYDENMNPLAIGPDGLAGFTFVRGDDGFVREPRTDVTVTFDIEGFLMTETVPYGGFVHEPLMTPVKAPSGDTMYMFAGWDGLEDGTRVYGDTVFKALFIEVDPCHVTIVYDDGTVYDTDVLPGSVLESPRPVKGYFLDEGHLIAWSEHRPVVRDIVLYATVAVSGTLDNIVWTIDLGTNTLTVTGEGAMPAFAKNTSTPWYKHRNDIGRIVVAGNVTSVSPYAFYGYSKVTEIVIGENVETLEKYSFKNCTGIQTLRVGNGLTTANAVSFTNAFKSLDGSTIKVNADNLRGRQFEYIDGALRMTSVVGATGDVTWFLNVDTNNLEFVGEGYMGTYSGPTVVPWYQYRSSINEIYVGEGVRNVCDYAFYSYPGVFDVVLSDTVESIGKNSFRGCPLNYIQFGKGFATVGSNALYGFTFYDSMGNVLKTTAKNLCGKEFGGQGKVLTEFSSGHSEPPYTIRIALNGDVYVHMSEGGVFNGLPFVPAGNGQVVPVGWYYYPVGTAITTDMYLECKYKPNNPEYYYGFLSDNIYWVVNTGSRTLVVYGNGYCMPDFASASDTPWYAYREYIDTVEVYETPAIGSNAFRGLPFVYQVIMDDFIETVGTYAFYREYAIEYMHISGGLTSVGKNAFGGLTFVMDDGNTIAPVYLAGADVFGTDRVLVCYELQGHFQDCTWHYLNGTLTLSGYVPGFASTTGAPWSKLNKTVDSIILDDVYYIGEKAFYNFSKVKTLDLRGVGIIEAYAFKGCDGLEYVRFGEVEYISTVAFSKSFVNVDGSGFGMNANSVSNKAYALDENGKLRLCLVQGWAEVLWTLDFTTGTLTIEGYGSMENLTSVTKYPWYQYRSYVTDIVVSYNVLSVGDYAFYSYQNLKSITFGADVTYIGINAIRGCSALETIEFQCNAFKAGSNAFYGMTFKDMDGNSLKSTAENLGGHTFKGSNKVFGMVA
ncbi:MAG: leucine-rich repeat domain-containing protein [archaeon]|nr:leucine-rich repeat domain-containing protein [archaeon]